MPVRYWDAAEILISRNAHFADEKANQSTISFYMQCEPNRFANPLIELAPDVQAGARFERGFQLE